MHFFFLKSQSLLQLLAASASKETAEKIKTINHIKAMFVKAKKSSVLGNYSNSWIFIFFFNTSTGIEEFS